MSAFYSFACAAFFAAIRPTFNLLGEGQPELASIAQYGGTGGLIVSLLFALRFVWTDRQRLEERFQTDRQQLQTLLAQERKSHREEISEMRAQHKADLDEQTAKFIQELQSQIASAKESGS